MNIFLLRFMIVFSILWALISLVVLVWSVVAMVKEKRDIGEIIFWVFLVFVTCAIAIPFMPVNQLKKEEYV